jgi:transcriptional regulator with XRE-family HTH domain
MPQIDLANAHKIVGQRLQTLRKDTGKSIEGAATEAGMTPEALSEIEHGEVEFHILTLFRLCGVYHTTPNKLLEECAFGPPK